MGEFQRAEATNGPYSRLLQQLATALNDAQSMAGISSEIPQELELRGLTPTELELIHAYLGRDLNWLRGWHAAAEEISVIERPLARSARLSAASRPASRLKPQGTRRGQLCCALCGRAVLQSISGVEDCQACGSKLFRLMTPA